MSKKDDENIRRYWKDHTKPVSLEAYANKLMQELEDRPIELKPEDFEMPWGWDLETVEAVYDHDRVWDRLREGEHTFNKQRADGVNKNLSHFAVRSGVGVESKRRQEPYFYFVPDGAGGYKAEPPTELTHGKRDGFRGNPGAETAGGKPPTGAEFGAHGHLGTTFLDSLVDTDGYGDHMAQALPNPMPMAVVVTLQHGPNKGQQIVGYREMVNGRLQFRVPVGVLNDTDRRAIQDNLNAAQTKFYKP